jgi:transposase
MGHQIRDLMAKTDVFKALRGHVEIDESMIGGRMLVAKGGKTGRRSPNKTTVIGMKQRGGNIVTEIIPNVKMSTIKPIVLETVEPGTKVSTDELMSYGLLRDLGTITAA